MTTLDWRLLAFDALRPHELYALLRLRSEVFVVEQNCIFQDLDGLDSQALHLLGRQGDKLLAYARLLPAGCKYAEASIGRVISARAARGAGLGHLLVQRAIDFSVESWGAQPIRIGAQQRLAAFYRQYGFVQAGSPYDEDGILHIEMLRTPATADSTDRFMTLRSAT